MVCNIFCPWEYINLYKKNNLNEVCFRELSPKFHEAHRSRGVCVRLSFLKPECGTRQYCGQSYHFGGQKFQSPGKKVNWYISAKSLHQCRKRNRCNVSAICKYVWCYIGLHCGNVQGFVWINGKNGNADKFFVPVEFWQEFCKLIEICSFSPNYEKVLKKIHIKLLSFWFNFLLSP